MKSAAIFLVAVTVFTTLVPQSATTLLDNVVKDVGGIVGDTITGVLNITDNVQDLSTLQQVIDKAAEAINQTVSSDVDEKLRDTVNNRLNRAVIIVANLIANIEEAKAKTNGVQNVVLTKILVELEALQGVAAVVYPSIRLAVNSGNNLAMKINADIIEVVIGVGEVVFPEMVTSLELTPGEVAAAAKTQVQSETSKILAIAKANSEDINKMLADRGYLQA